MAAHASWEEIEEAVLSDSNSPTASGSKPRLDPSQRWRRNDRDVTDLGPERLDDYIQVVKCERCTKPVLARYQGYHKENCNLIHDIKQGRVSPSCLEPEATRKKRRMSDVSDTPSHLDNGGGGRDTSTSISPHKKLTKKAAKALEVEERRRQRLEKKARKEREAAESKGRRKKGQPLDVNEQCGVLTEPGGPPCMRSLTCKTHSMGAKRAVPGRSRPYDELLLEWQKANNPAFLAKLEKKEEEKMKAMEMRRAAKMEKRRKKEEEMGGPLKKKKGSGAGAGANGIPGLAGASAGSATAAIMAEWTASQNGGVGAGASSSADAEGRPATITAAAMSAVNGGQGLDAATLSALLAAGSASSSASSSGLHAWRSTSTSTSNNGPTAVLEEFLEGGPTTDLYALHGMEDSEVDAELSSLLGSMRARCPPPTLASNATSKSALSAASGSKKKNGTATSSQAQQPLPPLPTPIAARRSRLRGTWCSGGKARARMMLRAALLAEGNGANGGAGAGKVSSKSASTAAASSATSSSLNGGTGPPPLVAGGGWGTGIVGV